jgi:hypothetical protein
MTASDRTARWAEVIAVGLFTAFCVLVIELLIGAMSLTGECGSFFAGLFFTLMFGPILIVHTWWLMIPIVCGFSFGIIAYPRMHRYGLRVGLLGVTVSALVVLWFLISPSPRAPCDP